jgi:starch phosphorylase
VAVRLNGLAPSDVRVELLLSRGPREADGIVHTHDLAHGGAADAGEQRFAVQLKPGLCGRLDYRIRLYPKHDLLTHPFEMGLMTWV